MGRRGWLVVFLAQQADLSGRLGATGGARRLRRVDWGILVTFITGTPLCLRYLLYFCDTLYAGAACLHGFMK